MSHKIIIIAKVKDSADYKVIRDNLADFPEVIDVTFPTSAPTPQPPKAPLQFQISCSQSGKPDGEPFEAQDLLEAQKIVLSWNGLSVTEVSEQKEQRP